MAVLGHVVRRRQCRAHAVGVAGNIAAADGPAVCVQHHGVGFRRPLGVEGGIPVHGVVIKIPFVRAGLFLEPTVEGVAGGGGICGLCDPFAAADRHGVNGRTVAVHVKGHGVGVGIRRGDGKGNAGGCAAYGNLGGGFAHIGIIFISRGQIASGPSACASVGNSSRGDGSAGMRIAWLRYGDGGRGAVAAAAALGDGRTAGFVGVAVGVGGGGLYNIIAGILVLISGIRIPDHPRGVAGVNDPCGIGAEDTACYLNAVCVIPDADAVSADKDTAVDAVVVVAVPIVVQGRQIQPVCIFPLRGPGGHNAAVDFEVRRVT